MTKRRDFDQTRPLLDRDAPEFSGVWEVYEDYAIVESEGHHFLQAKGGVKKTYRPLLDEPYLFLELARLSEEPHNKDTLFRWLNQYGLLGMHYDDGRPYVPEYYPEPARPPLMYLTEGGPGEGLMEFWMCVQQASETLHKYEATANRDEQRLVELVGGPEVAGNIVRSYLKTVLQESLWTRKPIPENELLTPIDVLVDRTLISVWRVVQDHLSNFAYPAINHELPQTKFLPHLHRGEKPLAVHRLGAAWGFRNLIGAAYLQFYWLIASRAEIRRCKYCGRIISLAPTTKPDGSRGRKPRHDKEYCNKWCQQSADYHRRGKHKRKSKRNTESK